MKTFAVYVSANVSHARLTARICMWWLFIPSTITVLLGHKWTMWDSDTHFYNLFLLREAHSPVCLICLANIDMSVSHLAPDVQVITRRAALFTHRCDKVIKQIKPNHMTRGLKSLRSRYWKQKLLSAERCLKQVIPKTQPRSTSLNNPVCSRWTKISLS